MTGLAPLPLPVIPSDRRRPEDNLPVFWEFVQWVLHTRDLNEHWAPISVHCPVCHVDFDLVLKMENMDFEHEALAKKLGWQRQAGLNNSAEERSRRNSNNHHNMSIADVTQLYFQDISSQDIKRLHELYKLDFLMFGYTLHN